MNKLSTDNTQIGESPFDQTNSADFEIQAAQQHAWAYLSSTPVREILVNGVAEVRDRVLRGLQEDEGVAAMGIEVATVRVSGVAPTAELEKVLQNRRKRFT